VLALIAFRQGWLYVNASGGVVVGLLPWGLVWSIIGLALIIGLRTRLVSLLFCTAVAVDTASQKLLAEARNLDHFSIILLSGSIAIALALLGPGSASLDARRFGRREIVIAPGQNK
jgi:uncharacterized membrane protein YphA (DoxX/SURF4 family)